MSRFFAMMTDPPRSTIGLRRRKRGRPPVSEDPGKRAVHLRVAESVVLYGADPQKVAERVKVCERTIYNWIDLALTYDGPIAAKIREARGQFRRAN